MDRSGIMNHLDFLSVVQSGVHKQLRITLYTRFVTHYNVYYLQMC